MVMVIVSEAFEHEYEHQHGGRLECVFDAEAEFAGVLRDLLKVFGDKTLLLRDIETSSNTFHGGWGAEESFAPG